MTTHRTCSAAESLIAVSWSEPHAADPHVLTDVEVVADTFLGQGRLVAVITVRLIDRAARARVSIDARHLSAFELSQPLPEGEGVAGSVFRRALGLPRELHDGRTHALTLVVDHTLRGRSMIASHEASFYARRVSNRLLMARPPAWAPVARPNASAT